MPQSRRPWLLVAALMGSLALPSCGGGPAAASEVLLLRVESVEVRVAPSSPPEVTALFEGILPDGCTSLGSITQERQGTTISVTVTTVRTGEVCTQVVQLVSDRVRLQGDFPSGSYVARVNGVEARFTL